MKKVCFSDRYYSGMVFQYSKGRWGACISCRPLHGGHRTLAMEKEFMEMFWPRKTREAAEAWVNRQLEFIARRQPNTVVQ